MILKIMVYIEDVLRGCMKQVFKLRLFFIKPFLRITVFNITEKEKSILAVTSSLLKNTEESGSRKWLSVYMLMCIFKEQEYWQNTHKSIICIRQQKKLTK